MGLDLLRNGGQGAQAPALVVGDATLTYGQLRSSVDRLAALALAGAEGALLLSFLGNEVELVQTLLAALRADVAVVLAPTTMPSASKAELVDSHRPELVLHRDAALGRALAARGYRQREGPAPDLPLWRSSRRDLRVHPDVALALTTSGTSGAAKLVRLSAGNVEANASGIAERLALGPGERAPTSLPLSYSYGLSILTSHLTAGATVVVTALTPLGHNFWRTVHAARATSFAGVPAVYEALLGGGRRCPPLGTVRTFTQAGGAMSEQLARTVHRTIAEHGGQLYTMYGQTEATARIAILPPDLLPAKLGTVGFALPGGRIEIEGGADGGEVIYRGPNVMMGYARVREDFERGAEVRALRTGDLGRIDADGCLAIVGRRSRFAKIHGRRLSLDELERTVAEELDTLVACTTTGAGGDERILAQAAVGADAACAATLELVRARVCRRYELPRHALQLQGIEALPLTVAGKVDYAAIEHAVVA
jgi:acyl-CoA synthetase (AMP-forming)/AMP-acid ligase II